MSSNLPVYFLACKVFEGIIPHSAQARLIFLDYGLHSLPRQLRQTLQAQIDAIPEPARVVLGYGLCGNGLHNLQAGKHTLVIPKADDCVAIFMGSRARYLEQFNAHPGTYYLTKGWFEVGSDPLSEYHKLTAQYGPETADWLMQQQYQHYKRLLFVAHHPQDIETYRPRALKVAAYCEQFGMRYEEYLGSEDFLTQIAAVIETQHTPPEFIIIPPGGTVQQEMFR